MNSKSITLETKALFSLTLVVFFWGFTFPLIHFSINNIDPIGFVFIRFMLAAVLLIPFVVGSFKKINITLLLISSLLGLCNFIVFGAQTIGLEKIEPNESAFITSASVIFVPWLAWLFRMGKPTKIELVSVFLGVIGLYYITGAYHYGFLTHETIVGILYTMCSAIFIALSIIIIQYATDNLKQQPLLLAFFQIVFTAVPALFFFHHIQFSKIIQWHIFRAILFCSIFATALAFVLQSRMQKYISPVRVALIFCLEPIFAVICTLLFFHHPLTNSIYFGGSIIILSILLPDYYPRFKKLFFNYRRLNENCDNN